MMLPIRAAEVPANSLLGRYVAAGAYADCYVTELPGPVSHAQCVEAFYTTAVFKVERLLLGLLISRPSTDAQAKQLAQGHSPSFAAWSVEARALDEVLLSSGRTRSWLMVSPQASSTRLFFGSAVVARRSQGHSGLGLAFGALLWFHKLYSQALLLSARARLSNPSARAGRAAGRDA